MKERPAQQPWIDSAWTDSLFILAPAFLSVAVAFLLSDEFQRGTAMPDYAWVVLVLLIDVAHVYSTLYRTYFDPEARSRRRELFLYVPLLAFVAGVMLYSVESLFFWRVLAYLAVFHFVRQQYGFLRLYSRQENFPAAFAWLDTLTIYAATVYPILHWHLTAPKNFNWFVADDFLYFQSDALLTVSTYLYGGLLVGYVLKEGYVLAVYRHLNVPKLGIMGGTIASWYLGIVYFNGDLAFTLLNVVAHGIPYMALVWFYGKKQASTSPQPVRGFLKNVFAAYGIPLFLGVLFLLAYLEEGLWDGLVWQEHSAIFAVFQGLPAVHSSYLLAFLVPLLSLPQATHYILDGFIWRISRKEV